MATDQSGADLQPPVRQLRLVVRVDDLDEAVRFFRDALGLVEEDRFGESEAAGVILSCGRATLELSNSAQVDLIDSIEVGRPVSPKYRVAFEVSSDDALLRRVLDAGATLIGGPVETPWRSRNTRLGAPAGVQVTLFEELAPRAG
jgi:lactoylglutathione lyase